MVVKKEKILFIIVMLTFGSIGLFVRNINLSSSIIAFFRATIGSIFIIIVSLLYKKKVNLHHNKRNIILLLISATAMGFNWIFLFEAYRYTTIASATLSYYFAPVIVVLISPIIFKVKWQLQGIFSITTAIIGLVLVVNPRFIDNSLNHSIGIIYGLTAAVLYASVILINQFIKNINSIERTLIQLLVSALVLFIYILITDGFDFNKLGLKSIILIIIVGVFHTSIAYYLYFSLLPKISSQTVAILSYIDPISAVLFSIIIFKEELTLTKLFGGILILGSTIYYEINTKKSYK